MTISSETQKYHYKIEYYELHEKYKKLLSFIKKLSGQVGSCKCLDNIMIEDSKKILKEIGEL